MTGFERATIWLACLTFIVSVLAAVFVRLQWVAMRDTLDEMKRSGDIATNQLWQAIGNMNWMARTADGSLHEAQHALDVNERQGNSALNASITASRNDQRAWLVPNSLRLTVLKDGEKLQAEVVLINSGKTPAINLKSWGRIQSSPTKLMVDDYMAQFIASHNPVEVPSIFPSIAVPTPSFIPFATDDALNLPQVNSVKFGTLLVYLFGDIRYDDAYSRHHLTQYCGLYDPPSGRFNVCHEHGRAD